MIFEKYILEKIDERNIAIYESKITTQGENVGKEYKTVVGYYGSLKSACMKLLDLCSKEDTSSTEKILENIIKAESEIIKEIKGL